MVIKLKDPEQFKKTLIVNGFTLRSFAKSIAISGPYLTQIANSDRNPGPKIAKKIADALGAEFDDIFFICDACKSYQDKEKNKSA